MHRKAMATMREFYSIVKPDIEKEYAENNKNRSFSSIAESLARTCMKAVLTEHGEVKADKRSAPYAVTVSFYANKIAESSDPDIETDAEILAGLNELPTYLHELLQLLVDDGTLADIPGMMEPVALSSRLPSIRTMLSRNGGRHVLKIGFIDGDNTWHISADICKAAPDDATTQS